MSEPIYSPGLEGVIAGETGVSTIEGGLRYRGYPVGELAEKCTFDEVAYLLLNGELPTAAQLSAFTQRIAAARRLPEPLRELLKALPKWTPSLDALYVPNIDDALDAENAKREFWDSFRALGRWYEALPPY